MGSSGPRPRTPTGWRRRRRWRPPLPKRAGGASSASAAAPNMPMRRRATARPGRRRGASIPPRPTERPRPSFTPGWRGAACPSPGRGCSTCSARASIRTGWCPPSRGRWGGAGSRCASGGRAGFLFDALRGAALAALARASWRGRLNVARARRQHRGGGAAAGRGVGAAGAGGARPVAGPANEVPRMVAVPAAAGASWLPGGGGGRARPARLMNGGAARLISPALRLTTQTARIPEQAIPRRGWWAR